jgi:hypothetical protein
MAGLKAAGNERREGALLLEEVDHRTRQMR